MSANRGVAYIKPGTVEVRSIDYPKLRMPKSESDPFGGKDAPHGVILRVVTTNICGSDQHMVRGRTTAPAGLILGHEITGEIIEKGSDVEMLEVGDLVSVPFNIVRSVPELPRRRTGICLTVNPARQVRRTATSIWAVGSAAGRVCDGTLRGFQPARSE